MLRDLGADSQVEERAHPLFEIQGQSAHGGTPGDRRSPDERDLLNRWMTLASLLVEEGVVEPLELITLVLSSQGSAAAASGNDRRSRLRAADAELREVSSRLEASLRDKRPELFDRAGRLRDSEFTRRLTGLTGGKRHLSGDDLLALESAADEEAARSPSSAT